MPNGISRVEIIEDLDPYDPPYQNNDGCWHIELLSTFDNYYSKIQQEPEYQEFTCIMYYGDGSLLNTSFVTILADI